MIHFCLCIWFLSSGSHTCLHIHVLPQSKKKTKYVTSLLFKMNIGYWLCTSEGFISCIFDGSVHVPSKHIDSQCIEGSPVSCAETC